MNQSIYLMLATPYLALAVVGFLIYRGCQQNAAYLRSSQRSDEPSTSDPGASSGA
jgi:hypothetical protein